MINDAVVIEESGNQPERFAALYDRHAPTIHRYLIRRVGRETAEDLLTETFLAAFRKRRRYDRAWPDARPWLYGIATNLVGQHRRDATRRDRLRQSGGPPADAPDFAQRAVVQLTAQATRSALAEALASLTSQDRDVLLLIAWEDLSYDEVSRALKIPVGTVKSRLHRARIKVREALANTDVSAIYEEIMTNE
jgi:RNA polymerase sigma-70 factor (ECF subfamily)